MAELGWVPFVLDDDRVVGVVEVGQPVAGQLGRLDGHRVADDLEAVRGRRKAWSKDKQLRNGPT